MYEFHTTVKMCVLQYDVISIQVAIMVGREVRRFRLNLDI